MKVLTFITPDWLYPCPPARLGQRTKLGEGEGEVEGEGEPRPLLAYSFITNSDCSRAPKKMLAYCSHFFDRKEENNFLMRKNIYIVVHFFPQSRQQLVKGLRSFERIR